MSMKTMRLQLGLVVMGGAVLLGCMIILFGTMPRFWEKSDTYYAQFEDAPGVSSGTPVRRSGVRVGQVADIVLDEDTGMVLVHFSLANPFKLRKHEIPTLNTGLLANDATIDLVPDAEGKDKSILEAGSVVLGKRAATVNSLLQNASAVVPTTQEALDEMRKSLQKLEKLSPLLQESLKEVRDLAKDVRLAIPEIKEGALATFKQYETLGKQANELLPKVNVNFEKAVADIRETAKSATSTFKEIDKIGADISAAARQIGGTAERVDRFVQQNADKMSKTIDSTIETVNRIGNLLNDDNQKQFGAILKNTKKASDRFDGMAQNFLDVSQEIQESVKWFIQFTRQLDESADPNRRTPRPGAQRLGAQRPGAQRPGAQHPIGALPQFPGGAYPLVGGVQGVIASNIRPTTQTVPLEGGIPALKTSQYTP
ncbi:MAG: MlaD family protein, partial [Gemmataceae bacterium]